MVQNDIEIQIATFCKGIDWVSFTINARTAKALPWIHDVFGKGALIVDHPVVKNRCKEVYLTRKNGHRLRTQFKELFGPGAIDYVVFPGETV